MTTEQYVTQKEEEEEEDMTTERCYTDEEYFAGVRDYWRQVAESEGFDIEDIRTAPALDGSGMAGLMHYNCNNFYPDRALVKNYAKAGLHRYNMLEGTSFELHELRKFNVTMNCVASYYITLLAQDPKDPTSPLVTFQVRIDEQSLNILDCSCAVARRKDKVDLPKDEVTTKTPFTPHFHGGARASEFFKGKLPNWPSNRAFGVYTSGIYELERREWQDTDWIYLYLELVLCKTDMFISASVLSGLEILKVSIETIEDVEQPSDRLKAKSANVYITFKGLAELKDEPMFEIGENVVRRVIVRRVLDEGTGYLTLLGKLLNSRNTRKRSRSSQIGGRAKTTLRSGGVKAQRTLLSGEKGQSSK